MGRYEKKAAELLAKGRRKIEKLEEREQNEGPPNPLKVADETVFNEDEVEVTATPTDTAAYDLTRYDGAAGPGDAAANKEYGK